MAIDRGQYHFEDAGSWEAACRHIGVFVAWAAKRGLLELRDELAAITRAPTKYVIDHLDCSLLEDNLTDEGARFADVAYRRFLREYNTTAVELDVELYRVPERHPEITTHMDRWLDAQLAAWREAGRPPPAPEPSPAVDDLGYHLEHTHGDVVRAGRHLALFLRWAAARDLLDPARHPDRAEIVRAPLHYLIERGNVLRHEDFSAGRGMLFVHRTYGDYARECRAYATAHGVDLYDIEDGEASQAHFYRWLDARLAALTGEVASLVRQIETTATRPTTQRTTQTARPRAKKPKPKPKAKAKAKAKPKPKPTTARSRSKPTTR